MAITTYNQTRQGGVTVVTVTSGLSGTIYYHWYLDGAWIAGGQSPSVALRLSAATQVRIECIDTNDADFDPVVNAPDGYPATRTITWHPSESADVAHYRIEQLKSGGDWTAIGTVMHEPRTWEYRFESPRLDDLTEYSWRVIPVDRAENDGTAITTEVEQVVRTPDAPDFTVSFDPGTTRVAFSAA
jgi:hypothetical protein